MALTIAKSPSPVVSTGMVQKPRVEDAGCSELFSKADSNSSSSDNLTAPFDLNPGRSSTQMSILTGPTSSHNVVRLIDPQKGVVVAEIPPQSASAIYALAQRWAQMMAK